MLWGLIVAAVLLLCGVVVFEFRSDRSAGWASVRRAAEMIVATFLGVAMAIIATDWHSETETIRGLCIQVSAASTEVAGSIAALEPVPSREAQAVYDEYLLVLTSPARLLGLLSDNRDYVEHGDPDVVPRLSALSSKLSWQPFPKTRRIPGYPAVPSREGVLERLRRALDLLEAEKGAFCGQ